MEMGAGKKSRSSSDTATAGKRSSMRSNSSGTTAAAAVERKEIERKRRQQMKSLCAKLASLIPKEDYSRDAMTQLGSLDEAAAYIKKLKERVDELQQKRSSAQLMAADTSGGGGGGGSVASTSAAATAASGGARSEEDAAEEAAEAPVVEVVHHHDGSSLDVVLISSVERPFKLHEVVTVLEEEGAEIINANLSVVGRKIFHTIHCRVRDNPSIIIFCIFNIMRAASIRSNIIILKQQRSLEYCRYTHLLLVFSAGINLLSGTVSSGRFQFQSPVPARVLQSLKATNILFRSLHELSIKKFTFYLKLILSNSC